MLKDYILKTLPKLFNNNFFYKMILKNLIIFFLIDEIL